MSWQLYEGDANAVPAEGVRLAARVMGPNSGPALSGVRWSGGSGSAVGGGGEEGAGGAEEALVRLEGKDGTDARPTVRLVDTG